MDICKHKIKIKKLPCVHYVKPGYCSSRYYQCIEAIVHKKPILTNSGINNFDRCPKIWFYDQIVGIQLKEKFKSLPMRAGSYLHKLLFNPEKANQVYFSQDQWERVEKETVKLLARTIRKYELLPLDAIGVESEVRVEHKGVFGFIDLLMSGNESFFCELKYTAKPENYLNPFLGWDQIETYFYVTQALYCYIIPIRRPQLRQKTKTDESDQAFLERIETDIKKRIKYYFPEYNPDRKGAKWGRKFWRSEIDFDLLEAKIEDVKQEIKSKVERKFFPMRRINCFWPQQCNCYNICSNHGRINYDLYEKKERKNKSKEV
jgi:hypothetical protein